MKLFSAAASALVYASFAIASATAQAQDSPAASSQPSQYSAGAQTSSAQPSTPAPGERPRDAERPVRPPKMPYGMTITLAQAKKVAAAAEAAAVRANVKVAIAVTDNSGELVYFEQLDDTSTGIRELAMQKARFSARFRMPTSYVGAMKRIGNDGFMAFPGAFPGAGGVTLTYDGHTIGGLGVSGGADGAVADAGAAALDESQGAASQKSAAPAEESGTAAGAAPQSAPDR